MVKDYATGGMVGYVVDESGVRVERVEGGRGGVGYGYEGGGGHGGKIIQNRSNRQPMYLTPTRGISQQFCIHATREVE